MRMSSLKPFRALHPCIPKSLLRSPTWLSHRLLGLIWSKTGPTSLVNDITLYPVCIPFTISFILLPNPAYHQFPGDSTLMPKFPYLPPLLCFPEVLSIPCDLPTGLLPSADVKSELFHIFIFRYVASSSFSSHLLNTFLLLFKSSLDRTSGDRL